VEKLGKKEPEKEVEAYITTNSVELAKDKWLCPLSGKKFKGPEFIRKHIANKHGEKLDEVRQEVVYYNNYLSDPRRPADVESARPLISNSVGGASGGGVGGNYDRGGGGYGDYRGGGGDRHRDFGGGARYGGGGGGYNRGYGGDFGGGGYGGGGGYRRDHYPRRDYGGGNRNYGGGGRGGQQPPPPPSADGRRDPRVPVAYTDLDAPEDIY